MATNKNQHYVPRCYLRPFTNEGGNSAINLFNVDRKKFIKNAPVKNQCSRDYFYGQSLTLENALQTTEGLYASVARDVMSSGYKLNHEHKDLLRRFWLLQYLRTEAASRRAVESSEGMRSTLGLDDTAQFKLEIKEAVLIALGVFVEEISAVDDMKVCLLRNRTSLPFISSDDPAVLTNRWHLADPRTMWSSFGLHAAGNLLLLPISPEIFCLGYDGDVYSVPHKDGWADIRNVRDVKALNQHQFLNCRANIFMRSSEHFEFVARSYEEIESHRAGERHRINYTVLDYEADGYSRYRAVDPSVDGNQHENALVHMETIHRRPSIWPSQLLWRRRGKVFTNDSGIGYVRSAHIRTNVDKPFYSIPSGK